MKKHAYLIITILASACATIEPTALQKEQRLKTSIWIATSLSGEKIGGDEIRLNGNTLMLKYNDWNSESSIELDSTISISRASSGFGGLLGGTGGAILGLFLGPAIAATMPSSDVETRVAIVIFGVLIGVPVGFISGVYLGSNLEQTETLDLTNQKNSEKLESVRRFIE